MEKIKEQDWQNYPSIGEYAAYLDESVEYDSEVYTDSIDIESMVVLRTSRFTFTV